MSTGSSYANTSTASRPIIALGATAQPYKTWCSASAELATHPAPPRGWVIPSLHGALSKEDRASISEGVFDPAIKAISVTLVCVGIAALLARISFFFL